MNSTQRNELVAYFAEEFERLADTAPAYRGISAAERRQLVKWLHLEFRRLSRVGGDMHGPCIYVNPGQRVVRVQPAPQPHLTQMSLPACLRRPDTEAGLARLGLSHVAYTRLPQNPALLAAMGQADILG